MKLFITALTLLITVFAFADASKKAPPTYIDGPLFSSTDHVQSLQAQESQDDIYIKINSPGGSVFAGYAIMNKMETLKAQGKRIHCYVEEEAQSMGFMILTACTHRYAARSSILMFHPVSATTGRPLTQDAVAKLLLGMGPLNNYTLFLLQEAMPTATKEWIVDSFFAEVGYPAAEFDRLVPNFVTITTDFSPVGGYLPAPTPVPTETPTPSESPSPSPAP